MAGNVAVIAGATGAASVRLVELLGSDPAWQVIGLCRRPRQGSARVRYQAVDLADWRDCRDKLSPLGATTHVFYTARAEHGEGGDEDVAANLAMLRNVVETIESAARGLRRIVVVHGTKYYGPHLGPYRTPAKEDDPRPPGPNFYYDQQDYIADRQKGKGWSYTIARPDVICDFAPERPRNLAGLIAFFGAIAKEIGGPLWFPGNPGYFEALVEVTDASLLARALRWMATEDGCANQVFNVINGDYYRWCNLWPEIASFFGMEPGPAASWRLSEFMADKALLWDRIVARYRLRPTPFARTALWSYGEYLFRRPYDQICDTSKIRRFGFGEVEDTHAMYLRHLGRYRQARLIP